MNARLFSPLIESDLRANGALHPQTIKPKTGRRFYEEVRYICATCHDSFDNEDDAAECCTDEGADAPDIYRWCCPVCSAETEDPQEATDCCLWKSLGIAERMEIARLLRLEPTADLMTVVDRVVGSAA